MRGTNSRLADAIAYATPALCEHTWVAKRPVKEWWPRHECSKFAGHTGRHTCCIPGCWSWAPNEQAPSP